MFQPETLIRSQEGALKMILATHDKTSGGGEGG